MQYKTFLSLSALTLFTTGCSWFSTDFRYRGNDYLLSEATDPLQVPTDMDSQTIGELYTIPNSSEVEDVDTDVFDVPSPLPLGQNRLDEEIKIQRLGDKRWVSINLPPSEAWPRVRYFLGVNKIPVSYTDPNSGVIETSWLQFNDDESQGKSDKYRLKIQEGVRLDSSEIHVTHVSTSGDTSQPVNWPEVSMSSERESLMLEEMAGSIASQESTGAASLLAQGIGGGKRVSLESMDDQEPFLDMQVDFPRAWASLDHALQQQGFTLFDQNSDWATFYVYYSGEAVKQENGWFDWFGEEEITQSSFTLAQILDGLSLSDTPENQKISNTLPPQTGETVKGAPGYLVFVSQQADKIEVRVRDTEGRVLDEKLTRRLLKVIRNNLI